MSQQEAQLSALKELLGRRRYRVALLHFGRGLTQKDISRRLRVSQPTVSRDVAAIERMTQFVRGRVAQRHRIRQLHAGLAEPFLN